jgi:cation diffusion facilitator family transporter
VLKACEAGVLTCSNGGEGGIRTPDAGITDVTVFETAAFNHSATSPSPSVSTHPRPFNHRATLQENLSPLAKPNLAGRGACILGRRTPLALLRWEGGRTRGDAVYDHPGGRRVPRARIWALVTKDAVPSAGSTRRYAVLSIVAAVLTISLKLGAYLLTGSVGLFSDAAESVVNLVAAVAALWALIYAARPPDEEHAFGHNKAEYFSSGLESALILIAAVWIGMTAWGRIMDPQPLQNVGLGLSIALVAAALNGGVALIILRAGQRLRSITLRADAHHLLTDVWTSVGVVLGIVTVQLTGWLVLDPLIGLVVAANIVWTGVRLLSDTAHGLLDTVLPPEDREVISKVLSRYETEGIEFHALRTRASGQRRFISMHVLVPGHWTVQQAHDLSEKIERDLAAALPQSTIFIHIEPSEDPASFADQSLDRGPAEGRGQDL